MHYSEKVRLPQVESSGRRAFSHSFFGNPFSEKAAGEGKGLLMEDGGLRMKFF